MANIVVLGTQWGDEGKGKIVDLLTPAFKAVARYQGGHNAGHTVYVHGRKIVLHLIPSGVLHPGTLCLIGNGVVIDPRAFLDELEALKSVVDVRDEFLAVSRTAHLILPYHGLLERASEAALGERKIGTTCRGIGPAYEDKIGRRGIRAGDLLDPALLREKIFRNTAAKNEIAVLRGLEPLDAETLLSQYVDYGKRMAPYIKDVSRILHETIRAGSPVLFEGAQGVLLDIDHGTYPFVTSSNPTAGGACTGLGVGPTAVDAVLGVTKAYATRVGSGPFPTELFDEDGKTLARKGDEFGATTGRPRRCGWFDAVAASYACRINGIEKVVVTKPDVLDTFSEIKVCTSYRYKGARLTEFPVETEILEKVTPDYETVPGWKSPVHGAKEFDRLPAEFKDYLRFLEDRIEAEAVIVSTGVEREETIFRNEALAGLVDLAAVRKGTAGA
ncbi:MAG: adenylosuccinate synthase [Candidatus Aminicenantes bacterium]|nr:adenylosuccinate synthase [Candidatus Aminicenantes bacterium]